MATTPPDTRGEPAGAGSIAFLIIATLLLVVITSALWISYFS